MGQENVYSDSHLHLSSKTAMTIISADFNF